MGSNIRLRVDARLTPLRQASTQELTERSNESLDVDDRSIKFTQASRQVRFDATS
jgi:hypothetical protein